MPAAAAGIISLASVRRPALRCQSVPVTSQRPASEGQHAELRVEDRLSRLHPYAAILMGHPLAAPVRAGFLQLTTGAGEGSARDGGGAECAVATCPCSLLALPCALRTHPAMIDAWAALLRHPVLLLLGPRTQHAVEGLWGRVCAGKVAQEEQGSARWRQRPEAHWQRILGRCLWQHAEQQGFMRPK